MKLHLPKLLCAAVLASFCVAYAATPSYTTDSADNKLYNVGQYTGSSAPSGSAWVSDESLTLSNSDKLGIIENDALYTAPATTIVKELWKGTISYSKDSSSTGKVTNNVEIKGTLTIKDTAEVILGGQHRKEGKLTGTVFHDEYTGIIADKILVQGGKNTSGNYITNLNTWNANVGTLQVDSGNVSIHTNGNGKNGNTSISVKSPSDSKQVRIKDALVVNGGTVTIGNGGGKENKEANDAHCQTGFGNGSINEKNPAASTISQSWIKQGLEADKNGGTLVVGGKSVSVGGLNIEQHKGTMSISDNNYHIIADNGVTHDSQIKQYGNATLTIGGILAENAYKDKVKEYTGFGDAEIHVTQEGSGTINLNNGVVFNYNSDETAHSSFTQTANGTINLKGTFGRNDAASADKWAAVYFDINQSGAQGTINVKDGAVVSAGDIVQSAAALLDVQGSASVEALFVNQSNGGTIKVADNATLTAAEVNAGQVKIEGAALSGGSISTVENKVTIAGDLAAADVTVNGGELRNEGHMVVSGHIVLKEGSSLVNKGTISASSAYALMMTDEQAAEMLNVGVTDLIVVEAGATLDNLEGNIEASVLVQGGTVTLATGSTQDITMESGEIFVTGQVETGSLTLKGGTINFSEGASVELRDGDMLDLNGATIVINVEDVSNMVDSTIVDLFNTTDESAISNLAGTKVQFVDQNNATVSGTITGTVENGGGSMTVLLPEPTTATLSLLALAGLAMRRRRK